MINIKGKTFDKNEIKLGVPIELEHTRSKKLAERIAKQHLAEFPHYYSQGLIPMEKRLKAMQGQAKKPSTFGQRFKTQLGVTLKAISEQSKIMSTKFPSEEELLKGVPFE